MSNPKLETIRNMLTKAEDPACTPLEAEALTAMAAKLMAKYGIEQAMLDAGRPAERGTVANRRIVCEAPYGMEKATMLSGLTEAMGGKAVLLSKRGGGAPLVLHVFGFESDLERAEMLYTSLLLQSVSAMVAAEYSGDAARAKAYGHVKAWRRSFLAGFASAVIGRVKAAELAARTEAHAEHTAGPSVALVVADRSKEVAQAFADSYDRAKIRTARRSLTGRGMDSGRAAGQRASLGGRAVAGGRAQIGA